MQEEKRTLAPEAGAYILAGKYDSASETITAATLAYAYQHWQPGEYSTFVAHAHYCPPTRWRAGQWRLNINWRLFVKEAAEDLCVDGVYYIAPGATLAAARRMYFRLYDELGSQLTPAHHCQ